ncbi:hypothetical protein ACTFIU_001936 [Dictyostelium citrinum]
MNESILKKLHGETNSCYYYNRYSDSICGTPPPIIEPEFRPPTKGVKQIDSTNLTISNPGGCGPRTFILPNGKNHTFIHSSPFIYVDHELIKFKYNQQYSKSVFIKVVSGGLDSNVFKIEYKPNSTKINSAPRGIVIIEGQRLSSSIKSTQLVKIENYSCNVISSTVDSINDNQNGKKKRVKLSFYNYTDPYGNHYNGIDKNLLKLEKENEEKLKKEGYKPILIGNGYTVLSNAKETSFSVSSSVNPKNSFPIEGAQIVNSNFTIDRHIKMKNPPDPLVFIKMSRSKLVNSSVTFLVNAFGTGIILPMTFQCTVTPCSGFMRYIKSYPVVGTVETSLEKRKGFTSRFQTSAEIKASASAGFFGCEASLEVSTGFEYEETVSSETIQSWKQTLTEGTYIVYQNALVYAYDFGEYNEDNFNSINQLNPGVNLKRVGNSAFMFVPINRDDPFTLRYQDAVWDPVEYDTLIDYLAENPNKWKP